MTKYILIKTISILFIIAFTTNSSQGMEEEGSDSTPPDSAQTNIQPGGNFNLAVLAIKGWQKISFSTPLFNCPFDPCCSNYAIHSISHKGLFKGILYTADRISRCHPLSFKYYPEKRGALVNEVSTESYFKSEHLPYLTIPLSLLIPGFNKMVNGRFYDGLNMFIITEVSAYGAYKTYKNDRYLYIPLTFVFLSFYLSDIYFNLISL